MTVLSLTQVVALCRNWSANAQGIATATAVIFAESGGDTNARCDNVLDVRSGRVVCQKNGQPAGPILSHDRGLCQFNSLAHPEVSDAVAADPNRAIGAMFHLSAGFVDFHPWAGYTSGNYRRFMPAALGEAQAQLAGETGPSPAAAAAGAVGGALVGAGSAVGGAASGIAHAAMSVPDFLAKLADGHTWIRVVQVVGGLVMVGAGAFMLNRDLIVGGPLGDAAVGLAHATAGKVGASSVAAGSFKLAPAVAAA